jgi:flagellar protein FlaJ
VKKGLPAIRSQRMRSVSRIFIYVGDLLTHITPSMSLNLKQSGLDKDLNITAREYLAVAFTSSLMMGAAAGFIATLALSTGSKQFANVGPLMGFCVGFLNYIQLVSYPKAVVNKRVKDMERNLLFGLRTILVQIRSGIPIFDAFVSVASGNYGQISEEFKIVIDKARSGKPVLDSLEELAVRNPSPYFRRAIWQMVNAMRSGSDIGENLECVLQALSKEQMVQIQEYKSKLNPLSMMYMMIAVIIPSLGITVMIILSTFPGMGIFAEKTTFWFLLAGVVVMQFVFMSMIKSQRPNLIG